MDRRGGPLLGWRAWRVADTRAGLRLRSAVYDDDWAPGLALDARCSAGHDAPAAQCSCGIYAARSAAEAKRYLVGRDDPDVVHRVVGLVALTGAVVEHERGWRGESGRPARIWVPSAHTNGEAAPAAAVVAALGVYRVRIDVVPAFAPAIPFGKGRALPGGNLTPG